MKNQIRYYFLIVSAVSAVLLPLIAGNFKNAAENAVPPNAVTLEGERAIEHLKQTGGYGSLAQAVTAARYRVEPNQRENEFAAANHANNLRAIFTREGLRLQTRNADRNLETRWRLKSVGRGREQTAVPEGSLQSQENRVELRRERLGLVEYFNNSPAGLEQGFVLSSTPSAPGNESLRLILQTSGDFRMRADEDGKGLTLTDKRGGSSLRYEKLKVWDADKKELPARMTVNENEVWLEVEDAAANYPVTIDPTFARAAKITASDGAAGDDFGRSVAISNETAVVGAPEDDIGANTDQGSAYVFVQNGSLWTFQQKLIASDGATPNRFGWSVAISGETVIVGAIYSNYANGFPRGSAYVFIRTGTTWTEQVKLIANDVAFGELFGSSVAISGETVIVGAGNTVFSSPQGSAYIFVRSGANWTRQAKLTANDGALGDVFGSSVAISGETAIIGAPFDQIGANTNQGSAYVFVRSGSSWTQQVKLTASDGAANHRFGGSVAISNETAIAGGGGAAYIFIRNGVSWTLQQKLAPASSFTSSVAISNETAIVGAPGDDLGANTNQGSAYIFIRSGGVWSQRQKFVAEDGAAADNFGISVAISNETAIVGAYYDDIGANSDQGSAYIYRAVGGSWQSEQELASDGAAGDRFGSSVAVSVDTAAVGAPNDDTGTSSEQGAVYVFVRSGAAWAQQAKLLSPDPAASEKFGASVAINRDRIIVGAPEDNNGSIQNQGAAYIFALDGANWLVEQKLQADDGAASDQFGASVSISGNRAIVGSPYDNVGANADQGSAYIFVRSGSPAAWTQEAKLTAASGFDEPDDLFGFSVGISYYTAVVGAPYDDESTSVDSGEAFIFQFNGIQTWTQADRLRNSTPGDRHGYSAAISIDSIALGSPGRDVNGLADAGRVTVYVRNTDTDWRLQRAFSPDDAAAGDEFGASVSISEDLIAGGSPFDDEGGGVSQGSAYVFARDGTTWTQVKKLLASDAAAGDQLGWSVSISGNSVIAGAYLDNSGAAADQGSAHFFTDLPALPTSASVTVAGRVVNAWGRPVNRARVTLTDAGGETRAALTNNFGFYRFEDVPVGTTYIFIVHHKRYLFNPQAVSITEETSELDFVAHY